MKYLHRSFAAILILATACCCLLCSCGSTNSHRGDPAPLNWGIKNDSGSLSWSFKNDSGASSEDNAEISALLKAIGGCSDTYRGGVSEETYTTAQDAAKAYVAQELVSPSDSCHIQTVSAKNTLSQNDISKLDIPDDIMSGAEAVEEYTVTYRSSEKSDQAGGASDYLRSLAGDPTATVHVYIIKYPDCYKYFTPAVVNGETLTKSYYDSIFNAEKYKNCTTTGTTTMNIDMEYDGTAVTVDLVTTATTKYDHNRLYMQVEQTVSYSETDLSANGSPEVTSDSASYALYVETQTDGSTLCLTNYGGTWTQADLSMFGFDYVEQLTPFADQYLDHTFFTKTSYGCRLSQDNFEAYVKQSVDLLSAISSQMTIDSLTVESGHADYYVSEGVLSGIHMKFDLRMEIMGATATECVSSTMSCTNYGTTTVEKPVVYN